MRCDTIAAQLYTARDLCRTPRDLARTLVRLKAAGYHAVQVSGIGPIDYADMAGLLAEAGLACCATHEGSNELLEDPGSIVRRMRALGCAETAYAYPVDQDFSTIAGVKRLCVALNRTGRALAKAGIAFSYHNHAIELHRLGGRNALEIIAAETDPEHVGFELDTYWLQAGGVDPLEWIARFAGRMSLIHLKDYGVDATGKPVFEEIGDGNLPIGRIVTAARKARVRWFIVEQDGDWKDGDPVLSLAVSYRCLAKLAKT